MSDFPCLSRCFRCFSCGFVRFKIAFRQLSVMVFFAGMGMAAYAAPFAYVGDKNLNSVAVVDMATYTTLTTLTLGGVLRGITEIVANDATGKIYVLVGSGIKIIDADTNTITGEIALSPSSGVAASPKAMVVSPDGKKVYVLTVAGQVIVIDAIKKAVVAKLAASAFGVAMAIDKVGEKVYVATRGTRGKPAITIIDGLRNTLAHVVSTGDFEPAHLSVNPANNRLYIIGSGSGATDFQSYRVLDPATLTIKSVVVAPWPAKFLISNFSSLAFNEDGSRLYLGTYSGPLKTDPRAKLPVLEVNSATGAVTRILLIPAGHADVHVALKLATSFSNDKFVLAVFLSEHLYQYSVEPARRAVFLDVLSNTVIKNLTFTRHGDGDTLIGDILEPAPETTRAGTVTVVTVLQAGTHQPLRRNEPVRFIAKVAGNNPTGKVVFEFVAKGDDKRPVTIPVALENNSATLKLPACNVRWAHRQLRKIVCSAAFKVSAHYKGDKHNAKSTSEPLEKTR